MAMFERSVLETAQQVISNICEHSPIELEEAYLFVEDPFHSHKCEVSIWVVPALGRIKEFPRYPSLSHRFKTPREAMPALVDRAVQSGEIPAYDAARLKEIFQIFMTRTSNRPSMASWDGLPWDWNQVLPRSLKHKTTGKAVDLNVEINHNKNSGFNMREEFRHLPKKIWSQDGSVTEPLAKIVSDCIKDTKKAFSKAEKEDGNKKPKKKARK